MVYVEEKWLKIRERWQYWVVVLDVTTELPMLAAILPSRSQWACRWLGRQLHRLKQGARAMSTDGSRLTPTWCRAPNIPCVVFIISTV